MSLKVLKDLSFLFIWYLPSSLWNTSISGGPPCRLLFQQWCMASCFPKGARRDSFSCLIGFPSVIQYIFMGNFKTSRLCTRKAPFSWITFLAEYGLSAVKLGDTVHGHFPVCWWHDRQAGRRYSHHMRPTENDAITLYYSCNWFPQWRQACVYALLRTVHTGCMVITSDIYIVQSAIWSILSHTGLRYHNNYLANISESPKMLSKSFICPSWIILVK